MSCYIRIFSVGGKAKSPVLQNINNPSLAFKIYFTYGSYTVTLTELIKALYIEV
jgi:hypothetical protein